MPRGLRPAAGGMVYHVLNRANARLPLFEAQADYEQFLVVLAEAHRRVAMRTIGYCVMPNHWHLLLWPREDGDLSEFMRWMTVTHTQRWHAAHKTAGTGHLYQGRFKSFPVQSRPPGRQARAMGLLESGPPILKVLRYIERNPLRAGLVADARAWAWSSLSARQAEASSARPPQTPPPDGLPVDWLDQVNRPQSQQELDALRRSIQRGAPYGEEAWILRTARALGIESTLRPRGRPPRP